MHFGYEMCLGQSCSVFLLQEWDDELQLLIKDMTGDDGYNDDLDAANRKVRAVYGDVKAVHGDVKSLEKLKEQRTITQWLGKVLTVTKSNVSFKPVRNRRKEMFYLTTHSTHFIYGYMASDIW